VARSTTYHVRELEKVLTRAIQHKGFSVVEILSQCPTYFGRHNAEGSAVDMLRHLKETEAPRGILVERDAPEYAEEYGKLIERLQTSPEGAAGDRDDEVPPCGN